MTGEQSSDKGFTIFASNLPEELNEDGIIEIFESYGQIVHLFTPRGAKWAYITYKTYREAEHAIRSLNEQGPLNLSVAFQRKKKQDKRPVLHKYVSPNDFPKPENYYDAPCDELDIQYLKTGTHRMDRRRIVPGALAAHYSDHRYNQPPDMNSVYPCDVDAAENMYNPYESVGCYEDTNAMWSRGCVSIDDSGKRYVTMGRGYTRYQIPEPHPNIEQQITRAFQERRFGLYHYGQDKLRNDIGKCQYCSHVTKLRCENCNEFYCCRECQITDWPRHKMECKTIPALVGRPETRLSPSSSDERLDPVLKPTRSDLSVLGSPHRIKHPTETPKKPLKFPPIEPENSPMPITSTDSPIGPVRITPPTFNLSPHPENLPNLPAPLTPQQTKTQPPEETISEIITDSKEHNNSQNNNQPNQTNGVPLPGYRQNKENNRFSNRGRNLSQSNKDNGSKKIDPLKQEQNLAFQRDPRATANSSAQIQVDLSVPPPKIPEPEEIATPTPVLAPPASSFFQLLSDKEFTDVNVVVVMPDDTFWVNRVEDAKKVEELTLNLAAEAQKSAKAVKLVVGEIYATQYEGIWHRVSVVSTDPPKVFYIDFGNEEPPESNDFRELTNFTKYPPFAIHLRLCPNRKVQVEDSLSVKMIGFRNGVIEVVEKAVAAHSPWAPKIQSPLPPLRLPKFAETPTVVTPNTSVIQSVNAPKVSTEEQFTRMVKSEEPVVQSQLPCIIDEMETNTEALIQFLMALDNNSYSVSVLNPDFTDEYMIVYEKLPDLCNSLVVPADFAPKIGDFVCGKRDTVWLRGYVTSLGPPMRLALVDEARINAVDEVMPMPADYQYVTSFGSICTFPTSGATINIGEHGQFKVTGVENIAGERVVKAVLSIPEHLKGVEVSLKRWKPTPEQKGIQSAELKTDSKDVNDSVKTLKPTSERIGIESAELKTDSQVVIVTYRSERIMYVRSLDAETIERTHRVMQTIAKWALSAPKLNGLPAIGQLVAAKFTDDNYYRAIVTKIENDKINVSYVDYGNCEVTSLDQLRGLSDELKQEKSCVSKIILKDIVTDVPPTKVVHEYLDSLVGMEELLVCKFDGNPAKDGVTLTTSTGESVNDNVNKLLSPLWKREDPAKETKCLMISDLEFSSLGEVGETVKAIVMYTTEPPFKYMLAPTDEKLLQYISDVLPGLLTKYCESTTDHYIPRTGEMCLAVYDGGWYRAVCQHPTVTSKTAEIHFVDYGNVEVVEHKNIRLMSKEFMSPSALSCPCIVSNHGVELINGKVPTNIIQRMATLVPLNSVIDIKIIKKDDNTYEIEMPEVRKIMVAEGLAKP